VRQRFAKKLRRRRQIQSAQIVEEPAGVIQQLAYGDPAPDRQPFVDRVVQAQAPGGDQLQHDRGDKGFRDAAGAESAVYRYGRRRIQNRGAAGASPDAAGVAHLGERTDRAGRHDLVKTGLQCAAGRTMCGDRCGHDERPGQQRS
jgi:hypothetical protein